MCVSGFVSSESLVTVSLPANAVFVNQFRTYGFNDPWLNNLTDQPTNLTAALYLCIAPVLVSSICFENIGSPYINQSLLVLGVPTRSTYIADIILKHD